MLPRRIGHTQEREYRQKQEPGTHDWMLLENEDSDAPVQVTLTIVVASGLFIYRGETQMINLASMLAAYHD
jgi:hypothetical protein